MGNPRRYSTHAEVHVCTFVGFVKLSLIMYALLVKDLLGHPRRPREEVAVALHVEQRDLGNRTPQARGARGNQHRKDSDCLQKWCTR